MMHLFQCKQLVRKIGLSSHYFIVRSYENTADMIMLLVRHSCHLLHIGHIYVVLFVTCYILNCQMYNLAITTSKITSITTFTSEIL